MNYNVHLNGLCCAAACMGRASWMAASRMSGRACEQMRVHGDPASKLTRKSYEGFLVESPLIPEPVGGMRKPVPPAVDAAALAELTDMGFPQPLAEAALRKVGGSDVVRCGSRTVAVVLPDC